MQSPMANGSQQRTEEMRKRKDSLFLGFDREQSTLSTPASAACIPHTCPREGRVAGWQLRARATPSSPSFAARPFDTFLRRAALQEGISAWARSPHTHVFFNALVGYFAQRAKNAGRKLRTPVGRPIIPLTCLPQVVGQNLPMEWSTEAGQLEGWPQARSGLRHFQIN